MNRMRTISAIALLAFLVPASNLDAQTRLATKLRYGISGYTEARGGDAAFTNPALAAFGDQPRATASFLGVAGTQDGSIGLLKGLSGQAWGKRDAILSGSVADGLAKFGEFGAEPGLTEVQWIGAHSGTAAFSLQSAAIASAKWDDRTIAALKGSPDGWGIPGVIDAGSRTDLAVVSTAAVGFGQGNGGQDMDPSWWSGLSFQASYVHMRERAVGYPVLVSDLRSGGSRLPIDDVSDDSRATRMDRVRLEGGWIWSAGGGVAWKTGPGTIIGVHGSHLLQLNRSRRADPFVGQTTFLVRNASGLELERMTDPLTSDSSATLREAANELASEQRWTPTIGVSTSTDFNGPIRRISVGAVIPLDDRPSLDNQKREVGVSVNLASSWLPSLHYIHNSQTGNMLAGAWSVGTCGLRLDLGVGRESANDLRGVRWTGQARISILQRNCVPSRF